MRLRPKILVSGFALLFLLVGGATSAAPGDTTWVSTFDQEYINWATPHFGTFSLPSNPGNWEKIILFLTIECPGSPGDCDPWDRLGHLRVVTADQGDVEIARFITPYDITIPGGPVSCAWTHIVTHYKSLLQDEVEFRLYIESWIGGDDGWLITANFAFIEGSLAQEPYKVVNLWQDDWVEYGNPNDPLSNYIQPISLDIPAEAEKVVLRVYATGHGQGNTDNCAEFCQKNHSLVVDGNVYSHSLWRNNCISNVCSPQGGTWQFNRAGWCPGSRATPWSIDVTSDAPPGQTVTVEYEVDPYENLCSPSHPDCVGGGSSCPDCNYNNTGHTVPIYVIQSQAIFYTSSAVATDVASPETMPRSQVILEQNSPNPFIPGTRFNYSIPHPSRVDILVYDVRGRMIHQVRRDHPSPGTFTASWDGRDMEGRNVSTGVYFYMIRVDGETHTRKMLRIQ